MRSLPLAWRCFFTRFREHRDEPLFAASWRDRHGETTCTATISNKQYTKPKACSLPFRISIVCGGRFHVRLFRSRDLFEYLVERVSQNEVIEVDCVHRRPVRAPMYSGLAKINRFGSFGLQLLIQGEDTVEP
jgi:hypothetical protein